MSKERYSWRICYAQEGTWDCLGTHDTRMEAEAELRRVRRMFPTAFLVRVTFRSVNRVRTTSILRGV